MLAKTRRPSGTEKFRYAKMSRGIRLSLGVMAAALALLGGVAVWQSVALGSPPASSCYLVPVSALQADPKNEAVQVLPLPPSKLPEIAPWLGEDLTLVPEIRFQEPLTNLTADGIQQATVQQLNKVKNANQRERDGFLKLLLANRPDLAGLPVIMGEACRMKQEHSKHFKRGLELLRTAMNEFGPIDVAPERHATFFWENYQKSWERENQFRGIKPWFDHIRPAHVDGLMQVLAPESAPVQRGLVRFLSLVPDAQATQALGKLAIFAPEKEARRSAVHALKKRARKDYTNILLAGLKYPWPEIAQRSAEALIELNRTDLAADLVALLDEPDPRLPVASTVNGEEILEAKQLVRLNHNQNCMLCHPAADASTPPEAVTAPVPIPGKSLPTFAQGYGKSGPDPSIPDLLVRVDVTYLRQNFSVLQEVPNADPWPARQRFDFLVRTVKLTPAQAKAFQQRLQPKHGDISPYQQAVLLALRELTGQDAGPSSQQWKKVLKLPN